MYYIICVCVCVYRLVAVPLHRAVVVFNDPRMAQKLFHCKTPLGVHLEAKHGSCNSIKFFYKVSANKITF